MSAVRMVAYGVLELPKPYVSSGVGLFTQDANAKELAEYREQRFKFDQLMKLVKDELHAHNMLLSPKVERTGKARSQSGTVYVLYGPVVKNAAIPMREAIGEGSFKACCIVAAKWLDAHEGLPE